MKIFLILSKGIVYIIYITLKVMNVNFYKIVCNNTGAIYVGSTTQTITQRLQKHENHYRSYLNGIFRFITSFIILENKNYSIELIDSVFCNDRKHRDTLERLHILNENSVNKVQPGRDILEWRSDNKEKIRDYKKQYYNDNKEKMDEYKKQWYQDNKEKLNERNRKYYIDNKEQIDIKRNEKINCTCGGRYTHVNKARHMKSKLHIDYLATL